MFTDVVSLVTSDELVGAAGLTKINLQGNPYCNKSWTAEDDSRRCTFYCGQGLHLLAAKV
ncbi:hypothetical protein KC19_9G106600 [Ceratodon purpureus]|uniref:Uncharacterized protein n=1 Tax=Ceratodon purpureus TaxID=3225 RepID=A0A8T0GSJ9_CERPU|nr:hypothetical protein KC19_9G106600 [Ceratodon purpureus]